MESLGHQVIRIQEDADSWVKTINLAGGADVFFWTQTYGMAATWSKTEAASSVKALNTTLPTVSFHLDIWRGLNREHQIAEEPFFHLNHVWTADGDDPEDWARRGVNHHWLRPAVYGAECYPGTPQDRFRSDVAFVGSWRGGYHKEWWPQREALLNFLRRQFRNRFTCWPQGPAVRGRELNDLYASTKVVVGDHCFADRKDRYCSDRLFETVGRGGFLVYPATPALSEDMVDFRHLRYFSHGDFGMLRTIILEALRDEPWRRDIVKQGQAHVRAHHTYADRVQEILDDLRAKGELR